MPKWTTSATVLGGGLIAAINGLAQGGYVSPEFAQATSGFLSAAVVLMRFRPSAGKSITELQSANPN
ncbi:MAG: hypothetical protein NZ807_04725 [Dehalococcoidia bacterium]|nr:hypothetical protein [Dehalococcoidia bacterium]